MIKILTLNGAEWGQFENYREIFDYLTTIENLKLLAKQPDFKQVNWSFTVYPPQRAAVLYIHSKDPSEAMKEAFEEKLSLIEICTGDYKSPVYTVVTPNVNIEYLKQKWCLDYCTFHHLIVKEIVGGETKPIKISGEDI